MTMQSLLRVIYPPQCLGCGALTEKDGALCPTCWRGVTAIEGLACDLCGAPLPGTDGLGAVYCDDCLVVERPWDAGRSGFLYEDVGRRLVLALKHGDRPELAKGLTRWLLPQARRLLRENTVLVPVPLHWRRLFTRRYNQAALLAQALANALGRPCLPDALIRPARTPALEGAGRAERFAILDGKIRPHPRHGRALAGRDVILIDDVFTSGATFAAATGAARAAGARSVCVLALARATKHA